MFGKGKYLHLLGKSKVQKQLYLIYFSVLSIPIFIIGIFLIVNTRRLLLDHYATQVNSDNLRVKSIMYDVTTNIFNNSIEIAKEETLLSLITAEYDSADQAFLAFQNYTKLINIQNNASVSSITIYTTNPTINSSYNLVAPVTSEVEKEDWYQKALSQMSPFWVSLISYDSGNNEFHELTLVRKIPLLNTSQTAVLCIKINRNYLKNRIQNTDLVITSSVNQDPVFFSTDRNLQDKVLPFSLSYEHGYIDDSSDLPYENTKALSKVSTLRLYNTKDYLYITTIDIDAYSSIHDILIVSIGIILIAAFVPFAIIFVFTKYFTTRVNSLRQAMHKASNGEYDIKDTFNGDDELSETFSDLKIMIENIKAKEALVFQEKINKEKLQTEQQKIEFKMLASQINPHFLYNTLETIRMQAFTAGNRDVATSIKLLGKSMHYVLENTGTASTTLIKELDYIRTYLSIQKLRFNDRINYTLTVDNTMDLDTCQILPLLIQPIVENAILHGLEGVEENGQIEIEIKVIDSESMEIVITDNGCGMTSEELSRLTKKIQEKDITTTRSIGLYNINQRIKLCYGNNYNMKISSAPGEGTQVILSLPLSCMLEE